MKTKLVQDFDGAEFHDGAVGEKSLVEHRLISDECPILAAEISDCGVVASNVNDRVPSGDARRGEKQLCGWLASDEVLSFVLFNCMYGGK